VELIDSAPAIARRTGALLDQSGRRPGNAGSLRVLATGDPQSLAAAAGRLLGEPVEAAWLDL
jgi:hypothetical protein